MLTAFSKNMLTEARHRVAADRVAADRVGGIRVGVMLVDVASALPATAQGAPDPTQASPPEFKQGPTNPNARTVMPWDRKLGKFYQRQKGSAPLRIPVDRAFEKLNRDPMAKINRDPLARLGFGRHVRLPGEPKAAKPSAPTFDPGVSRLDADGDGLVSRDEYVRGNDRLPPIGTGPARQRGYRQRLKSQFGYADQNGDGKVSPQELQSVRGARF
jgi:hypothetical protein